MTGIAEHFHDPEQATPPNLDEEAFFETHLARLESEAAVGVHTDPPLRFIASIEQETQIIDPLSSTYTLNNPNDPKVIECIKKCEILPAPDNFRSLDPKEERERLREFHQEALDYVGALQPADKEQAAKKERWLAMIPELTIPDMINFKVYAEFSRPTLGNPAPSRHASYQTLGANSNDDCDNWLEFRFGNELHQKGWYDNEDVTEFRLMPCSPSQAVLRHKIIEARMIEIAAQHGCLTTKGSSHVHLSAFQEAGGRELTLYHSLDGTIQKAKVGAQVFRSILGSSPGRKDTNLRFVAGLAAAIKDGAWIHGDTTEDVSVFKGVGKDAEIAEIRESVRLLFNRGELRQKSLMSSPAHGLLWLMAAVIDGQQRSLEQFERDGYAVPRLRHINRVERAQDFDKGHHLGLQRAIEKSVYIEDAGFQLAPVFNLARSHLGLGWLTGMADPEGVSPKKIKTNASIINMLVMQSLRIDEDGRPFCTPELLYEAYASLPEQAQQDIETDMSDPTIVARMSEGVNKKASGLRIVPGLGIRETIKMEPLMPSERYAVMLGSRAMRLAYGLSHGEYAFMLMKQAIDALGKTSLEDYISQALDKAGVDL